MALRTLLEHVSYDTFCWKEEKMRCPNCHFQNDEASGYCERCGTSLQASTQFTKTYIEDTIPPPRHLRWDITQHPHSPILNMVQPRPKITVLRSNFYFLAIIVAAVGIYGTMNYLILVPGLSSAGDVDEIDQHPLKSLWG